MANETTIPAPLLIKDFPRKPYPKHNTGNVLKILLAAVAVIVGSILTKY